MLNCAVLSWCAGVETEAPCGKLGKSVNLWIPHDTSCSAPTDRWALHNLKPSGAVKPISLTLIKSYFSEHKIFLNWFLKGKQSRTGYLIKLIHVASV